MYYIAKVAIPYILVWEQQKYFYLTHFGLVIYFPNNEIKETFWNPQISFLQMFFLYKTGWWNGDDNVIHSHGLVLLLLWGTLFSFTQVYFHKFSKKKKDLSLLTCISLVFFVVVRKCNLQVCMRKLLDLFCSLCYASRSGRM